MKVKQMFAKLNPTLAIYTNRTKLHGDSLHLKQEPLRILVPDVLHLQSPISLPAHNDKRSISLLQHQSTIHTNHRTAILELLRRSDFRSAVSRAHDCVFALVEIRTGVERTD